jgi:beta-glucosidase
MLKRTDFPADFAWGTAAAAYQIEGTEPGDGRGASIWDTFCAKPGAIYQGQTGEHACEHYTRYAGDVDLMGELGVNAYRFSISWPRLLPLGAGKINQQGIDFYNRLIDRLLEKGITPFATLYHWDLPQALQDAGGWASRDICGPWREYAALCFDRFGDRVKNWFTHNEPYCAAFIGNLEGVHAPGIRDIATAIRVAHHLLLTHAQAVELFRSTHSGKIGIVLNLYPPEPFTDSQTDKRAADLADQSQNRWFLDPLYRGEYPAEMRGMLEKAGAPVPEEPGDLSYIKRQTSDFMGVNFYFRKFFRAPEAGETTLPYTEVLPETGWFTDMPWEVHPSSLTDLLVRIKKEYTDLPLLITENGAAFKDDTIVEGKDYLIDDEERRRYIEEHIAAGLEARKRGVNLAGYFVWSFMDNFEWAFGYSKRFGIFHTDYQTQKRSWKKSARWYQKWLKGEFV